MNKQRFQKQIKINRPSDSKVDRLNRRIFTIKYK